MFLWLSKPFSAKLVDYVTTQVFEEAQLVYLTFEPIRCYAQTKVGSRPCQANEPHSSTA
jgi:hypothetical protein